MFTQDEIDLIKTLYTEEHLSLAELGRQFNCSPTTIKNLLLRYNIHIRTRGEQTHYTNMQRSKSCDDNYFSNIDTYNKAWVLGFLMADGSITPNRNCIKIALSTRDKHILEDIKKELKIERNVKDSLTNNGFEVSALAWSSLQQKTDLAKYGIVPQKTYKECHLPLFDDKKYTLAFILGFMDGDGSISVSKEGYLRLRFCGYRDELLKDIRDFLYQEYQIHYSFSKDPHRQMHELSISTIYADPILKDMYDLNTICLKRKHQKYLEYKAFHESPAS